MVMGYLWVCPNMVVSASVSTYLGWRSWYVLMVWISGTVDRYLKTNSQHWKSNIIIPHNMSFGTSQNLPLWVHIFLMNIFCFNITLSWPKQTTRSSPSFILTLNKHPKFPFSPLLYAISWNCGSVPTWYSTISIPSLESSLGLYTLYW